MARVVPQVLAGRLKSTPCCLQAHAVPIKNSHVSTWLLTLIWHADIHVRFRLEIVIRSDTAFPGVGVCFCVAPGARRRGGMMRGGTEWTQVALADIATCYSPILHPQPKRRRQALESYAASGRTICSPSIEHVWLFDLFLCAPALTRCLQTFAQSAWCCLPTGNDCMHLSICRLGPDEILFWRHWLCKHCH